MDTYSTQQTLIGRIRNQQDQKSWEEFVQIYRPYLYRVISNMGVEYHDCEELMQKVLLGCWKALPAYVYSPGTSRFRTWLCTLARNQVLMFLRTKGRESKKMALVEEPEEMPAEVTELIEREWEEYITSLARKNIQGDFSGNALQCFSLISEGLPGNEVAERLSISAGSVYVLKQRVTKRFYREINRLEHELG
ncbi:MAG: sigma-70 family RNA polymerase sigma factor [Lentisphaeraceae bacterium]|nr:sigma-70 family RNA polymerase sigma factor [Lentisphaeraceae bacterium]